MKPISNTAFYCCGVRMDDARQAQPVCNDSYAALFMNDEALRIYDIFKDEVNCNASMLVRHRIIDDALRELLHADPQLCVITIGAGLDSRPYRLHGGSWTELDEPAVISYKNERLAASDCANSLQRISIDFCTDILEDKLSSIAHDGSVVIVMEGVFIYLSEDQIKKTLDTFHRLFPEHKLICDLVNRDLVQTYGRTLYEKIEGIGAAFQAVDCPEAVFTINGYKVKKRISVVEKATDFGINKIPKLVLKYFFSGDVRGNSIYLFESHELYSDLVI